MNILFLGPDKNPVLTYLQQTEDRVLQSEDIVSSNMIGNGEVFLVSYGYRHIITPDVLEAVGHRSVNLHISLLPYNRGADPNFWSFVEDSPKGVTIHRIDKGLDTGPVFIQKEISFSDENTLRTTYARLHEEIQQLFISHWMDIRNGILHPATKPPCIRGELGKSRTTVDINHHNSAADR